VPYVKDQIRRHSERYADRMKEHPNILTENFMKCVKTPRRVETKKKSSTRPLLLAGAVL